jgi:DNA primase
MNLSPDIIKDYLEKRFTDNRTSTSEFMINSLFEPDEKYHMSINLETGLWQDFKSKEKGNFYQLVSIAENLTIQEVNAFIKRQYLSRLDLIRFYRTTIKKRAETDSLSTSGLNHYLKDWELIDPFDFSLSQDLDKRLAGRFLLSRGFKDKDKFYLAKSGKYINRVIIPYIENGNLLYFQARSLSLQKKIKYLNPGKKEGVYASKILYPFRDTLQVMITEGVFDTLSLNKLEYTATCISGSLISIDQARQLKGRHCVLSLDSDAAGKEGIIKSYNVLKRHGMCYKISVCSPPPKVKDWNEAYLRYPGKLLQEYINQSIMEYEKWFLLNS